MVSFLVKTGTLFDLVTMAQDANYLARLKQNPRYNGLIKICNIINVTNIFWGIQKFKGNSIFKKVDPYSIGPLRTTRISLGNLAATQMVIIQKRLL